MEWRSFYVNDLPILMDISDEVKKLANQNGLSRAQILALETLKSAPASNASCRTARRSLRTWHVWTPFTRESGDP